MKETAKFESSSGLSRQKIETALQALLALRTLVLAVGNAQNDGEVGTVPEIGVSPFIWRNDGLYIYTSRLSQHVRDLIELGEAGCLLCADEVDSQNIWARCRLKFTVKAVEVSRYDPIFDDLCSEFTTAHGPTMGLIRNFTDFHMFRLVPVDGVLVLGFAKAFRVSGPAFDIVAHLSEA